MGPKTFCLKTIIFSIFTSVSTLMLSQNEAQNWYFGQNAGLNFSTNPPTILTNGMLNTFEGCASISSSAGNLLFYTDGITVYNQMHAVMNNGTGLNGNSSTTQSAIIVKKPASTNIYYIFTQEATAGANGLSYSEVDMSLAAGMGSVTVKNYSLYTPSCEKITAIRHCNGVDTWVVSHDWGSNNFRTYLITAAGVSLTPVVSVSGTSANGNSIRTIGQMKVSPNGKKLGLTVYDNISAAPVELHDFNSATGIVSNPLLLGDFIDNYGCEFSPDGTLFYSGIFSGNIMQWNICAGANTAILSSSIIIPTSGNPVGQMQLASNGKIYIARGFTADLSQINFPNLTGTGCGYNDIGQSLGSGTSIYGLPNFINSFFKPAPSPFTYTASCSNYSFTAAPTSTINAGCGASSNPVTNILWNFGDPGSGAANTSTLSNPTHTYPGTGTYTTQLILYYACYSDTLRSVLSATNASPNLSVTGTYTICKGDKRVYTVSGANTYTWSTGAQTTTISPTPTVTTVYSVTGTGTNTCKGSKQFTVTVNKCTGIDQESEENSSVNLYPNPATSLLNLFSETDVDLKLINQIGQIVFEKSFKSGLHAIDISELSTGIYTAKVKTGTNSKNIRLIKTD
jgi:hypothetical protein